MYFEIQLPANASELELNLSITEHISEETNTDEDNCVIEHDNDEKDPMVRKVEKMKKQNYTIQLLHSPRENEKVTQMMCMVDVNNLIP